MVMCLMFTQLFLPEEYKPTLLGSIPLLEEKQAMEALNAASSAYNNGQGLWPTIVLQIELRVWKNLFHK